jgi:LacI family transcriptional regulator
MESQTPRVTMAQIAHESGSSLATVSKVFNGRPGVGTAKRDQILALLAEHGYRPRDTAARKPAMLVDFVMRGIDTLWATQMLVGAEEEAARRGVGLVVSATHGRTLGNRRWIDRLALLRSDGLILVVSRLQQGIDLELKRLRIPYVLVDPIGSAPQGVPVIGATNAAGGRAATEHLLHLGHRDIAIITGDEDLMCSRERLGGYRAALAEAGITPLPEWIHFGDFQADGGRRAAEKLLDSRHRPTAIFAGSDLQAHGVYEAARARGLAIPRDLSVVGFDDVPMCGWVSPSLTTIRQPLEEMARLATSILLAMAYQGVAPPGPKLELATSLVIRDSTAPPPPVPGNRPVGPAGPLGP